MLLTVSGSSFVHLSSFVRFILIESFPLLHQSDSIKIFYSYLVMQAGFGMLEAGSVQEKNHRSILFKVRVKQA
jgi:hypothetical protein